MTKKPLVPRNYQLTSAAVKAAEKPCLHKTFKGTKPSRIKLLVQGANARRGIKNPTLPKLKFMDGGE